MQFHHICIQTSNYSKSLEFYTEVLGFDLVKESNAFHKRAYNSWLMLNGVMIELQTEKEGDVLSKPSLHNEGIVHCCFFVSDIEGVYEKMKTHPLCHVKQKNHRDIYQVEGGKLFKLIAPEGTIIEIRNQKGI